MKRKSLGRGLDSLLPKKKKGMHVTKVSNSEKCQRIVKCLIRRSHTGIELQNRTGLLSISTWVSNLRHNGYNIVCDQLRGGREPIYRYTLVK